MGSDSNFAASAQTSGALAADPAPSGPALTATGETVPLIALAYARSGDKGNRLFITGTTSLYAVYVTAG